MYIKLEECKKCSNHKQMEGSFVYCHICSDFLIALPSMPSHYIYGFQNGTFIVNCRK